eukprot:GHUV01044027.1.p2 GENE.GHUV01044027.1~~GHUV01044027.1.p2  ORF type:complete len:144 (+),score=15.71 GHUV01044027.1:433-864(+)
MGVFNQASRLGSIAAPFMLMLGTQLNIVSAAFIPYMVFGGVSALAGLLVLLLPETLGAPMPESMEVSSPDSCTLNTIMQDRYVLLACGLLRPRLHGHRHLTLSRNHQVAVGVLVALLGQCLCIQLEFRCNHLPLYRHGFWHSP